LLARFLLMVSALPDLSVASQFMDVNFLDGYRIELIDRG
jgi:hypothetical protein